MAEFFYNLSICNPNEKSWPHFAVGNAPSLTDLVHATRVTIDSNKHGFVAQIDDVSDIDKVYSLGVDLDDFDLVFKCRYLRNGVPSSSEAIGIFFRASGFAADGYPTTAYMLNMQANPSNERLYLQRTSGTNISNLQNANAVTPKTESERLATDLFIRLNVEADVIRARAWFEGETEPTTWAIDDIDTNITASGDIGILVPANEVQYAHYFVSIGTDTDDAPISNPTDVGGVLTFANSNPAAGYTIRLYHRATGVLLGEAVTNVAGGFSIPAGLPDTEETYLVAIDDVGNTLNLTGADRILPA